MTRRGTRTFLAGAGKLGCYVIGRSGAGQLWQQHPAPDLTSRRRFG